MRKEVVFCDKCKKQKEQFQSFSVAVDTTIDSPSGRTEYIMEEIDLCLTCLGSEFKKFLHPLDIEKATAWVKSLKTK